MLAFGYSPAYLLENEEGIRQDWPRVPLPNSRNLLELSADLGRKVAQLLDIDRSVPGVTDTGCRPELRTLALPSHAGRSSLSDDDLALTAGWGHPGQGGATMPGKGNLVEREYSKAEREAISSGANLLGLPSEAAVSILGRKTYDVYLNDVAFWANVPVKVWDYTIGGYQVVKKWLSYREEKLLGRPLSKDEVRYVQEMVRRIAALLLLQPALDANYEVVKADAYPWPQKSDTTP